MGYQLLTQRQRYQISPSLEVGTSQRQLALTLGCHSSTVSRELRRNSAAAEYDPEQAQAVSDARTVGLEGQQAGAVSDPMVTNLLKNEWSPEQIAGVMKRIGSLQVSHQWIYAMIYRDKAAGGDLRKRCRLPERRRYQWHLAKSEGLGKTPTEWR